MSQMSAEHGAINLAQGFPDFELDPQLLDLVAHYVKKGANQYAPMAGLPALQKGIAAMVMDCYERPVTTASITITSGATEALYAAITAVVNLGDEVLVLDPSYDSYRPAIQLNGGIPISIPLEGTDFHMPWEAIRKAINSKTKLMVINTPHNPTGTTLSKNDFEELNRLMKEHPNLYLISDEVYEHIVYDGNTHWTAHWLDCAAKRVCVTNSFGKTFHATGWKMGYAIAGEHWTNEIRKIHQFLTFSVNTPIQHALADYLSEAERYTNIGKDYQLRRDAFVKAIEGSRFTLLPCQGTYFQLLSYKKIADKNDKEMAEWLTVEHQIASIPISVFYDEPTDVSLLRFCFAKNVTTIQDAGKILCKI